MKRLLERHSPRLMDAIKPQTRDRIHQMAVQHRFTDGEMVGLRGETVDRLSIVFSGACRMCRIDLDGRERLIAVLGEGQTIGAMQLLLDKPRTVDVFSVGETEIGSITNDQFQLLLEEHSDFAQALLLISMRRFSEAMEQLDDSERLPLVVRIAKLLLSMLQGASSLELDWSQTDLAQMLGASRVAVGKSLRELADLGFIDLRYASVKVIDSEALKRWVNKETGDVLEM